MNESHQPTLRQERDFGAVLTVTAEYLKADYRTLFTSLLYLVVPALLALAVINYFSGFDSFFGPDLEAATPTTLALFFVSIFGSVVVILLFYAVVWCHMKLYEEGLGRDPSDVWSEVKRALPKLFGATCLIFLLFAGSALIILLPIVGIIAYLVGVVYFAVALSLVGPVLVNERVGIIESLGRSRSLVKGSWWMLLGVMIILTIISTAISWGISLPVFIATFVSAFHGGDPTAAGGPLLRALTTVVGTIAWIGYLIPAVGTGILYYSLNEELDRPGLEAKVDTHFQISAPSA